jgi:hypothetical protein
MMVFGWPRNRSKKLSLKAASGSGNPQAGSEPVFLVAAPEGYTSIVAQSFHIVFGFQPDVVKMRLVAGLQVAV